MFKIELSEFITGLSDALHLVFVGAGIDWGSMQHGPKVCYIASRIAEHMDFDEKTRSDLYYAALLHDSGLPSNAQLKDVLRLDAVGEFSHCRRGFEFLGKCPLTRRFSDIVLHHHDKWASPNESDISGEDIPLCSRIIYLADRVDILIHPRDYILHQRDDVVRAINERSGTFFDPQVVKAFNETARLESFWLDLTARQTEDLLRNYRPRESVTLNYHELEDIACLFAEIVDSKSEFTLKHSRRVSRVATQLAKRLKFSPSECEQMKIAGLLHDLGKLSIPDEILDKPDALTKDEWEIVKRHTYFTYRILDKIRGFETINQWASLHHERLDGAGYPFHIRGEELTLGSRIMAVSDTFTATAEDRPYRKGFPAGSIPKVLNHCVSDNQLDGDIVKIVTDNIAEFYGLLEEK